MQSPYDEIQSGTLQAIASLEVSERETVLRVCEMSLRMITEHRNFEHWSYAERLSEVQDLLAYLCNAITKGKLAHANIPGLPPELARLLDGAPKRPDNGDSLAGKDGV